MAISGTSGIYAQSLSVGLLGGGFLTEAISSFPNTRNFTVGPALQVNLPALFRIEVDALYRPAYYAVELFNPLDGSPIPLNKSTNQWQFPFLLQYRFKTPVLKPFLEAGVSFDHTSGVSSVLGSRSHASVVLGAGVDVKIPFVRLSGELRYSHAGSADFAALSNLNQAEVLVGVHF
ncbi:MAG TPA: hypothetical protein VG273_13120 [Bryobacteraceae bacterium]|nr:hypothetical protein [Bryobacteraceae bacterium]